MRSRFACLLAAFAALVVTSSVCLAGGIPSGSTDPSGPVVIMPAGVD